MDQISKDRKLLLEDKCPSCQRDIKKYFITIDKPMCEYCDLWFEVLDNGWVMRNENAKQEYNKEINNVVITGSD